MIIENRTRREQVVKSYDWPENYYMEMDPVVRKQILEDQMKKDSDKELEKRKSLFEQRYTLNRKKEYKDGFMEACLDLLYLTSHLYGVFSARANKKMARKIVHQLCLDKEKEYGTEILYEELCHLIKVYIMISMDDSAYRSVFLKIVNMDDEHCREKIKGDLLAFSQTIPESLNMENEFELFKKAIIDTQAVFL